MILRVGGGQLLAAEQRGLLRDQVFGLGVEFVEAGFAQVFAFGVVARALDLEAAAFFAQLGQSVWRAMRSASSTSRGARRAPASAFLLDLGFARFQALAFGAQRFGLPLLRLRSAAGVVAARSAMALADRPARRRAPAVRCALPRCVRRWPRRWRGVRPGAAFSARRVASSSCCACAAWRISAICARASRRVPARRLRARVRPPRARRAGCSARRCAACASLRRRSISFWQVASSMPSRASSARAESRSSVAATAALPDLDLLRGRSPRGAALGVLPRPTGSLERRLRFARLALQAQRLRFERAQLALHTSGPASAGRPPVTARP